MISKTLIGMILDTMIQMKFKMAINQIDVAVSIL